MVCLLCIRGLPNFTYELPEKMSEQFENLVKLSLDTQTNSVRESQPLCSIIVNNNASNEPSEAPTRAIRRTNSNDSSITADCENEPPPNLTSNPPPTINFCPIEALCHPPQSQTRELLHSCLSSTLPNTSHLTQINVGDMRVVLITHQC